jgi:hypothetical protein
MYRLTLVTDNANTSKKAFLTFLATKTRQYSTPKS